MKIVTRFRYWLYYCIVLVFLIVTGCEENADKSDENEIQPPIDTTKQDTFPALGHDGPYSPDSIYYGRESYVEYHAGNLPIILSAPHGGWKVPDEIPDRTYGTTVTDANTYQLTKVLMDSITARFGAKPHVILSQLKRIKLDPNRDSIEAAQEDKYALRAWQEYHHYIETAKKQISDNFGSGLFLDMHGHGQNPDGYYDLRIWLGYLLSGNELDQNDEVLNTVSYKNKSSIRALADSSSHTFIDLLRGGKSMGTLLDSLGYACVPSTKDTGPAGSRYFSGGYNTVRHGSRDGGSISAIQIEAPKPGIRENQATWSKFSSALTTAAEEYYQLHLGRSLKR